MSLSSPALDPLQAPDSHRVALIEPVGGHGGMDYYDLGLCRGLIAAGWQVSWYTCAETADPHLSDLTFHPVFRGIWGKASKYTRALHYLQGTLRALLSARAAGQRVCHFHLFHGAPEELLLLSLSKLLGRRIVITVHDVESFAGAGAGAGASDRGLVPRLYALADRFIVHNATSRQELITVLKIAPEKITIIPHGNYLDTLGQVPSSADARQSLGIGTNARVVLFFGQIKQVKGLDLLLDAMPQVLAAVPEVVLVIAGRPWKNDFTFYEKQIEELGIAHACKLHIRFIDDAEVGRFYAAADVVVLPYRRIYQSGVVLLAMSYAKAVLVSDLPGMTEIVTDGVNGYTFATGSSTDLAAALLRVFDDDPSRKAAAESAFTYVRTYHDWMQIGRQTALVYESIKL